MRIKGEVRKIDVSVEADLPGSETWQVLSINLIGEIALFYDWVGSRFWRMRGKVKCQKAPLT